MKKERDKTIKIEHKLYLHFKSNLKVNGTTTVKSEIIKI